MKTNEEHVYGESFARTMKLVAMDVIQLPLIAEDVREIMSHLYELLVTAVIAPLFRVLALILFPISVPLIAYLHRRDMERTEKWRKDFTARWVADHKAMAQKMAEGE